MNYQITLAALVAALLLPVASPVAASADDGITVRLAVGQSSAGAAIGIDGGNLELKDAQGKRLGRWMLTDVDRILFAEPDAAGREEAAANAADSIAATHGGAYLVGGKLCGAVVGMDMDSVTINSESLAAVKLPLAAVRAVQFSGDKELVLSDTEPDGDILILSNGDRVPGTINEIKAETVSFNSALGDMQLQRSRVSGVVLMAPPGGRRQPTLPALRVGLTDGSSLMLQNASCDGDSLRGMIPGNYQMELPVAKIAHIDIVGGRLVSLDILDVAEYQQQSIDLLSWQVIRGRNVLGGPMRLTMAEGGSPVTFTGGLGVHGPCRVKFELGRHYERFVATVGIDESAGEYADVNIVVKLDGREVFRADSVKWRQAARQLQLDVSGARWMELIVEAGEHFDVQDRVNWADARLLKVAPEAMNNQPREK